MNQAHYLTLKDLKSGWGGYADSTLRHWIRTGKLISKTVDGRTVIPLSENSRVLAEMLHRKPRTTATVAWAPEALPNYGTWHDALDCNVWLLCVHYGSKELLRRKGGRLDLMLANYLRSGKVNLRRIRAAFSSTMKPNRSKSRMDLHRGWYHELAFATPLRAETLDLSASAVTRSIESSCSRLAFPTWRIVSAYYSLYFFIRSASLLKTSAFRLEEHQAAIRAFTNNLAGPLGTTLWRYPLSLTVRRTTLGINCAPDPPASPHAKYAYSLHPRYPHRTPNELGRVLRGLYRKRLGMNPGDCYGLIEFFRDFRVWANYQDVDNLLKLQNGGFKAYLDRNLSVLLFFIAMVGELSYLAVCGQHRYLSTLQQFYESVTADSTSARVAFSSSPVMQRLAVYRQLGFVNEGISFRREANPHEVLSLPLAK